MKLLLIIALLAVAMLASACQRGDQRRDGTVQTTADSARSITVIASPRVRGVVESAVGQHRQTRSYDPSYQAIGYPNGDVPLESGVCADVIVRAFRAVGTDLQKEIHEDMRRNFTDYPNGWGAKASDPNIDHRRVANLMKYFERRGTELAITSQAADYLPGDVVAWRLENGRLHIGVVTNIRSEKGYLVAHNIGRGVQIEDILFTWDVIGHYRYFE